MAALIRDHGIIPGIKVDAGTEDLPGFPGEKFTAGLDGLRGRLAEYRKQGARFAKWRAVISIGKGLPTRGLHRHERHDPRALRRPMPGGGPRADRRA